MCSRLFRYVALTLTVIVTTVCWSFSNDAKNGKNGNSSAGDSEKIPITTKSEDARKEFLVGRDLADRLLAQDPIAHFDKAITLDPEFASAELARANSSATA